MKTKFLFCILTAAVIAFSSFLGCIPAVSQEISEGKEFYFGLPYSYETNKNTDDYGNPVLTGCDWQKVRIIDDWQKNQTPPILNYKSQIELSCTGNDTLSVKDIIIENDPFNVFSMDKSQLPQKIIPGFSITIKVFFAPVEEMEYTSTVRLITNNNGEDKFAIAPLHGIGTEPHINVSGYEFPNAIIIGKSSFYENCYVQQMQTSDLFAMQLTLISNFTIEGPDKDAFEIDPNWVSTHNFPIIIPIGDVLVVPVRFTPTKSGQQMAQLVAHSDAPKEDNNIGNLIGTGYSLSTEATNYNFPTIYIHTTLDNGIVSLINTGSGDVTITRDINQSLFGADILNFNILDWFLSSNTLNPKPQTPITLKPGDTLYVSLSFSPIQEKVPYNAYFEYVTSIGTEYSYITGGGMVLRTVAEIPKYWTDQHIEIMPGQKQKVDFKFYKNINETKEISDANITSFTARVHFNLEDDTIYILPDVNSIADIMTEGTMTEGWSCNSVKLINNNLLEVKMYGASPLSHYHGYPPVSSGDILFHFNMNTFPTSRSDKPLILTCELQLPKEPYVYIDSIPGDIKISLVSGNTEKNNFQYLMSEPKPNPIVSTSIINFTIINDGNTTFDLYDSFGNRLEEVFNENLQSGSYQLTLNTDALHLSSGIYFIRMESGAYSETRKVVVVK
jgi:hypothetical protein